MARSDESHLRWPTLTSRHLRRLENLLFRGRSTTRTLLGVVAIEHNQLPEFA